MVITFPFVLLIIVVLYVFREPVNIISDELKYELKDMSISNSKERVNHANEIMSEIISEHGTDFLSTNETYTLINSSSKKRSKLYEQVEKFKKMQQEG